MRVSASLLACFASALFACGPHAPASTGPTTPPVASTDPCRVGPRPLSAAAVSASKPVLATRRDQFAVGWEETSESERRLRLQVFDGHGAPLAPARTVATLRTSGGDARLTATDDGYAIAWSADRDATSDVLVQRLDAAGAAVGPAVTAFSAESARPLALAHGPGDGFLLAWWQWAADPHREVATWLDRAGARVADVELTRLPPEDPVVDFAPDYDSATPGMDVAFEQQVEGQSRIIVGRIDQGHVVREGSEYPGRDPALLREGPAFTIPDEGAIAWAPFGAAAASRLAGGRMVDAAILGNDSVLCRAQLANDRFGVSHEELSRARERGGVLLKERTLARFAHAIGAAQLADTAFGYAVAVEGEHPDDPDHDAVLLTTVTCND